MNRVEEKLASLLAHHERAVADSAANGKRAIDEERKEKKILCQWLNGFIGASSKELRLGAVDFAFARLALNVAVAAQSTPVETMLEARVPAFLVGMLSSDNEVLFMQFIVGCSFMCVF